MFSLNEGNRFVVCLQGVDLRKGLDGLCGMIRYLSLSPTNGDVYVFLNKSWIKRSMLTIRIRSYEKLFKDDFEKNILTIRRILTTNSIKG